MENTIGFSVRDNNNFYKIDISKTLLHFIEFDFTYFWEQCIEAGRVARKTGRLPQSSVTAARAVAAKAHPYIEACISTDYSEIVTDCIIEYICHSERIGLEELWARCISPKNMYETAIFRRISEYKTSRAMNRWTSLVRLQEYAQNKVEFIFGPENGQTVLKDDFIRARKEYFDLALSVAANELGCPPAALPSVKLCNPATVPNAAFAVGKVAKTIYHRFADTLANGRDMSVLEGKNCSRIQDQTAMEAYAYIKNMTRPSDLDMRTALEAVRANLPELYLPDSLKAAIDLEFDFMCIRGIYLRKCDDCGRYFTVTDDNPRCDRVNSSGKTCRKQYEELCESIAVQAIAAEEEKRIAAEEERRAAAEAAAAEAAAAEAAQESSDAAASAGSDPEPPEPKVYTVPKEMEKRGQKLYNALYKRVGRGIDENEFREWSQYLSNMKKNIKNGEATAKQFEDFLDYSDRLCEEVKRASKNKTVHAPVEKTYEQLGLDFLSDDKGKSDKQEAAGDVVEATVIHSSENADVKPFVPQTFDTRFDAFMAGYAENSGQKKETTVKKDGRQVEVKAPQWKHLTREDAYGNGSDDKKD